MSASTSHRGDAGFIMIEMLAAIVLMVIVVTALATVTAQWMPNWNRGVVQVQQMERLGIGIDRVVNDIAAAQFIPLGPSRALAFDGGATSVSFVRTVIGPALRPGLEFVRLSQRSEAGGTALVRERAAYNPGAMPSSLTFGDPVTLVRAPYRIDFGYADVRQGWRSDWRDAPALPRRVRLVVREAATDRVIAASTVAVIAADTPAECVRTRNIAQCLAGQARSNQPEL